MNDRMKMKSDNPQTRRRFLRTCSSVALTASVAGPFSSVTACGAQLRRSGQSFVVLLSHAEVNQISAGGQAVASVVSEPHVAIIIEAVVTIIQAMDAIGGNNGVEVSGTIGSPNVIVLPQANGILGSVIRDVAEVAHLVQSFEPSVILAKFVISSAGHIFGASRGEIHCDENRAGSEETFFMGCSTDSKVAFLSFNGYFHASSDDHLLYANRDKVQRDEKFDLIHNSNGTISLKSFMGTYVCADRNRKNKRVSVEGA